MSLLPLRTRMTKRVNGTVSSGVHSKGHAWGHAAAKWYKRAQQGRERCGATSVFETQHSSPESFEDPSAVPGGGVQCACDLRYWWLCSSSLQVVFHVSHSSSLQVVLHVYRVFVTLLRCRLPCMPRSHGCTLPCMCHLLSTCLLCMCVTRGVCTCWYTCDGRLVCVSGVCASPLCCTLQCMCPVCLSLAVYL